MASITGKGVSLRMGSKGNRFVIKIDDPKFDDISKNLLERMADKNSKRKCWNDMIRWKKVEVIIK